MKDKILLICLSLLLLISVVINVIIVRNKQINIMSPVTHNHTHQEQFQGQLMVNMMMAKGNVVELKYFKVRDIKEMIDFLTTLHPTSSYFAQVVNFDYTYIVYPNFLEEKNEPENKR